MVVCNSTLSDTHWKVDPVVGSLTFHTLGWLICVGCTVISTLVSFFLIYKHASNYTNRGEQRQIIRILWMVPIYSVLTMFSYVWYWHEVYWTVARDCYEAFAVASFFSLMCCYIAPELHEQKVFFATMRVEPWPWPVNWINKCIGGKWRPPRNGLTWFNIVWICIFQYCFIRVATTIIATVTQAYGKYCEDSNHPAFAHFWCMFFDCIAVSIAMYMLIAFYMNIKQTIADKKPLLKLLCIKMVIFLCFWQMVVCTLLSSANIVKPSRIISPGDIAVGFNAILVCFEMIIFSIFHLFAFPATPYIAQWETQLIYGTRPPRARVFRALLDVFNPFDIIKAVARGIKWCLVGHRHRHEQAEKLGGSNSSVNLPPRPQKHNSYSSTHPLVAPPGSWPSSGTGGLGVYAPLHGGLTVEHPTPNEGEHVATVEDDVPTHGLVETAHSGYRPQPSPQPPNPHPLNTGFQPSYPPQGPTSPRNHHHPTSPHAYSPQELLPASPHRRRPTFPTSGLPYPASEIGMEMPNPAPYVPSPAPRSPDEHHELLHFQPPTAQPHTGGFTYSGSMVNSEGVYQGPNPRRPGDGGAGAGYTTSTGERWREV